MTDFQFIEIGSPAFKAILEDTARQASRIALEEAKKLLSTRKDPEWVKAAEARRILGIGKTKLQELRTYGKIEFTEGRKSMYRTRSLYAYLEKSTKS